MMINPHIFIFLVTDYLKFYNDPMENLIKNVSLVLDKSNTSCMTLPTNGDTPPVFLMKMNASVLLGVSGPQFTILLHGEDLLCEYHGGQSSIQVRNVESFYDPLLKFSMCREIKSFS